MLVKLKPELGGGRAVGHMPLINQMMGAYAHALKYSPAEIRDRIFLLLMKKGMGGGADAQTSLYLVIISYSAPSLSCIMPKGAERFLRRGEVKEISQLCT